MLWFPDITDVPKLGCFGLELKRPTRAGSTGEAGVPMGFAVRWNRSWRGLGSAPADCAAVPERVRTGVVPRWPLPPGARAGGLRHAIIGFCIYETS